MEVCERNSCVYVTIATRDAVTGEELLESLNAKGKITKVIDRYTVAVKKEGITIGDLPQKCLEHVEYLLLRIPL